AACGPREGGRYLAGNGHERSLALVAAEGGEAVEEPARVRMARVREDLADRAVLDQLARVHDADAVAHPDHRAEVVADEEHGGVMAAAQLAHEVEHRGFHRHVETGGAARHGGGGRP